MYIYECPFSVNLWTKLNKRKEIKLQFKIDEREMQICNYISRVVLLRLPFIFGIL